MTPPYDPGADVIEVIRATRPPARRAAPTASSARRCAG